MKKQLKHIVVNINDLKPAAYNPREELYPGDPEYENIKNSIQEFGYADAIVVNKDLTVIGGHQRLNVLKDLGYSDIEVAQVDLTKKQEKALNIALNKITGRWDDKKLADLFKDLNADSFKLNLTGFNDKELSSILNSHDGRNPQDDTSNDHENERMNTIRHEINGEKTIPHTHLGYVHDENGSRRPNKNEQRMIDRVIGLWYDFNRSSS